MILKDHVLDHLRLGTQNIFPPSTGKPTAKACEVWEVEQKLPAANIFSILRNLEPKFQLS